MIKGKDEVVSPVPPMCPLSFAVFPRVTKNESNLDPTKPQASVSPEIVGQPCLAQGCMLFDGKAMDCRINVGLRALDTIAANLGDANKLSS